MMYVPVSAGKFEGYGGCLVLGMLPTFWGTPLNGANKAAWKRDLGVR